MIVDWRLKNGRRTEEYSSNVAHIVLKVKSDKFLEKSTTVLV